MLTTLHHILFYSENLYFGNNLIQVPLIYLQEQPSWTYPTYKKYETFMQSIKYSIWIRLFDRKLTMNTYALYTFCVGATVCIILGQLCKQYYYDYAIDISCFFAKSERAKTGWFGIGIKCSSGATCLSADCYFSELVLWKSN